MTEEQYERWKDFSMRMAADHVEESGEFPTTKWVTKQVGDILYLFECDYQELQEWCDCGEGMCDWESCEIEWKLRDLVDDQTSHWLEIHEELFGRINMDELFDGCDDPLTAELVEIFRNHVTCSVRAGFDVAVNGDGGVIGFTVGELRRMYPQGIPEWITRQYTAALSDLPDECGIVL